MGGTKSPIDILFDTATLPPQPAPSTYAPHATGSPPSALAWGPFQVDLRARVARWDNRPLALTPLELRIFASLIWAQGAVLSHATLAELVWGHSAPGDAERLHAHIRRIRRKLETAGCAAAMVRSVRGEGYQLAARGADHG